MPTTSAFKKAYAKLNTEQKKAVDAVEGPVIVLAGPGTGKTSILTVRVANILAKTSAKPDEILVLTFTDSAARTVAHRLAELVGEDTARKIGVFTFHSFAAEVIRRHASAFPELADRRQMNDLEQALVWRAVLEKHGTPLLSTPKSPFHYLKDLKQLEDEMTRERLSPDAYRAWLIAQEKRIQEDPTLRYIKDGTGGAAGDLKPKGAELLARLKKGRAAATLIEEYRAEKDARGLYGFTDVLRAVVDALGNDEALRADVQEQYQYALADEHQDANALQHELVDALAFDEHPNLFIVGDEQQAIFGFQGADVSHFETLRQRYPRAVRIVLTENYRSFQEVLDLAHGLLADVPSARHAGHARLRAARGAGGRLRLLVASDPLAERDQVAALVAKAIAEGVPPHEIAVITLKNKTADRFALHLRARGISVLRAGDIDLEGRPALRALLALMRAVGDPTDSAALRESLCAPWWKSSIAERARFLRATSDRELEASLAHAFPSIAALFARLREEALVVPPVNLLSLLLQESGARDYLLARADTLKEDVPLVRALMQYVEELARRAPNATFAEVVAEFAKAREHELGSLSTTRTEEVGSVTVITAHKAKGMEFARVFVTALTKAEWEGRGKSALVPSPFDARRAHDELIRIFYVAATRAKDELTFSYAAENGEGREQAPCSLLPLGLTRVEAPVDPLPPLFTTTAAPALVRELTLRYLTHDGLSPSAYNEYLESPPAFFAKRVLRLAEPETRAIAVGNAVHAAIAQFLKTRDERAAHAELTRAFRKSLLPRGDTFDALVRHGATLLAVALNDSFFGQEALAIEETFRMTRTVRGKEIILKGKVDALIRTPRGVCIVDFKTSSSIDKETRARFARQIAFYDLLARANGHEPVSGRIVRLSEEGIEEHDVPLSNEMRAEFATTLGLVLRELLLGRWRAGSSSDYDALIALFK